MVTIALTLARRLDICSVMQTETKTQARRIGTAYVDNVPRKAIWAVWHGNQWGAVWTAEVQIHLDGDEATAIAAVRHE